MGTIGLDAHVRSLPLQSLNQVIVSAQKTTGLVRHADHGSEYVSLAYNERLAEYGIAASTGSAGDSYAKLWLRTSIVPTTMSSSTHGTWVAGVEVENMDV